jgi:hypothetical protein
MTTNLACHDCGSHLDPGAGLRLAGFPLCGPCGESHAREIDALLAFCKRWSPVEDQLGDAQVIDLKAWSMVPR